MEPWSCRKFPVASDLTGDAPSYSIYRCPTAESSIVEQTYDVSDDNITTGGSERFCCSEVSFQPWLIGSEVSGIYGTPFQIKKSKKRRVVRRKDASSMHRDLRTIAQLHQYALVWDVRISRLCLELRLENLHMFLRVSMQEKWVDQNTSVKASLSSGRFTYVTFIIGSTRIKVFGMNWRIYLVVHLRLSRRCGFQTESTLNPASP